eukprot:Plantae.Rhodophyta-Purpureofilum_apyrenoidigerum.ctg8539.p1 GENE.Plantae.Rhodophyta-Purpureofilum_apyrenoidigerum.ctg8539~~Plantae.Rhodophyta-Purpureofilum_apyrenoidigerum.ctg8539.p1  ORF type:complete len:275 (-),score=52.09 Plantae.Rhodophyta-Purpureofilum_apyrenoidigerum.ctg8539:117-941(-)
MVMDRGSESKVELALFARGLPELDRFSSSDPFAVVFVEDNAGWRAVGRTETVWDEPNPDFAKKIVLPYNPDGRCLCMVKLYDNDAWRKAKSNDDSLSEQYLKKQDFIGSVTFDLSKLVENFQHFDRFNLEGKSGFIIIHAEEISPNLVTEKHFWVNLAEKTKIRTKKKVFTVVSRKLSSSAVGPRYTPIWRSDSMSLSTSGVEFGSFYSSASDELRLELCEYQRKGGHTCLLACDVPIKDEATSNITFHETCDLTGAVIVDHDGAHTITLRIDV